MGLSYELIYKKNIKGFKLYFDFAAPFMACHGPERVYRNFFYSLEPSLTVNKTEDHMYEIIIQPILLQILLF